MLFNSYEFVLVFLPIVLGVFYLIGAASCRSALLWLVLASLGFYAWWRPFNVLIIVPSILLNFFVARRLVSLGWERSRAGEARLLLVLGVLWNVGFLAYFKYSNLVYTAINDVADTNLVLTQIVLPLGISFITFQKIAFLVDAHAGRVKQLSLREYCLFILFFPQLIAGPIVHFREMMPQFRALSGRFGREDVALGLTLFCMGLFKKVVLADGIAPHVTSIYDAAARGEVVSLIPAWTAAVGFTLQIYFDFSGYSDMATGIARCFGIRLPINFSSPLKAASIIEFWDRWHITLTRFLTAYVYNPLLLYLTRRRLAKGLPPRGGSRVRAAAFVQLVAFPTLLTMFVSGIWHGAGYLFILWGLVHGVYLTLNHAWRSAVASLWPEAPRETWYTQRLGVAATFASVALAMILFRSPTPAAARGLLHGALGLDGVAVPQRVWEWIDIGSLLFREAGWVGNMTPALLWTGALLAIALLLPNSLQVTSSYEPVLGPKDRWTGWLEWRPTLPWALGVAALAASSILRMGGKSQFLYWNF